MVQAAAVTGDVSNRYAHARRLSPFAGMHGKSLPLRLIV